MHIVLICEPRNSTLRQTAASALVFTHVLIEPQALAAVGGTKRSSIQNRSNAMRVAKIIDPHYPSLRLTAASACGSIPNACCIS